jgi:superoxide dismutase
MEIELEKALEVVQKANQEKVQIYIDKFNALMEEMDKEKVKFIIEPEIIQKGSVYEINNKVIIQVL